MKNSKKKRCWKKLKIFKKKWKIEKIRKQLSIDKMKNIEKKNWKYVEKLKKTAKNWKNVGKKWKIKFEKMKNAENNIENKCLKKCS